MTSSSLSALVQAFTMEERHPDILARRSLLDDLVDHGLSISEIRYLRDRLLAVPFNKDIFMNLPNELFLSIVPFLGLEDFLSARSVSRAWKEKFSSPDVCTKIVKLHFRSTWQKSYKSVERNAQDEAKTTLSQWLPFAATKRLRRQQCKYRLVRVLCYGHYDREWATYSMANRDAMYNDGRIAVRVDARTISVESLISNKSGRLYMDPNRQPIEEYLLSDRFLIVQTSNKLALQAWNLKSKSVDNVRLPSSIRSMSADRRKAGIITNSNEALVWHIGGSLNLLDTSKLKEVLDRYVWETSSVLFHPTKGNTTFVVHQAWHNEGWDGFVYTFAIGLIVQEFIGEQLRDTYHLKTTYKVNTMNRGPFWPQSAPSYTRRLGTGPYNIGNWVESCIFEMKIVVDADGQCGFWRRLKRQHHAGDETYYGTTISFVTFDMYTKKFDVGGCQPDFPEGNACAVHGHAVDMFQSSMRDEVSNLAKPYSIGEIVEGDDDFVVFFGDSRYVLAMT